MNAKSKKGYRALAHENIEPLFQALTKAIDPKPELHFESALDLLVAVVLSAQCTDKAVNKATAELWKTVRTAQDYLDLGQEKLEKAIHTLGFYRVKAEHLLGLCRKLIDDFQGEVPQTREELTQLPGVGRKTANVVLNVWFHQPTLAVDTHIFRVAHRLGLSKAPTPEKVELDLLKCVPEPYLPNAHHYLLLHGRYICTARAPHCQECVVRGICPKNEGKG